MRQQQPGSQPAGKGLLLAPSSRPFCSHSLLEPVLPGSSGFSTPFPQHFPHTHTHTGARTLAHTHTHCCARSHPAGQGGCGAAGQRHCDSGVVWLRFPAAAGDWPRRRHGARGGGDGAQAAVHARHLDAHAAGACCGVRDSACGRPARALCGRVRGGGGARWAAGAARQSGTQLGEHPEASFQPAAGGAAVSSPAPPASATATATITHTLPARAPPAACATRTRRTLPTPFTAASPPLC